MRANLASRKACWKGFSRDIPVILQHERGSLFSFSFGQKV